MCMWVFSKLLPQALTHPPNNLQAAGGFCLEGYEKSETNHDHFSLGASKKDMRMTDVA